MSWRRPPRGKRWPAPALWCDSSQSSLRERQPMGKKVTVVGAGFYGSTTAQRLAEYDIFETVVLTDLIEDRPASLALDMNQSRPVHGFATTVLGATTGPNGAGDKAIDGSDAVVAT